MRKIVLITVIIALAFALTGCKHEDDGPKNQSATISLSFDQTYTATVKGNLTDEEWKGVAGKIESALNDLYTRFATLQPLLSESYSRGIIINIEKTPTDYTTWKTIGDGKTLYLAYAQLDNVLQNKAPEEYLLSVTGYLHAKMTVKDKANNPQP